MAADAVTPDVFLDRDLFLRGRDETSVLELRGKVWGDDHPHTNRAFLDWLFAGARHDMPAGVLVRADQTPVGFAGLCRKRLWLDGRETILAHGLDYMTRPGLSDLAVGRTAVKVARRWLTLTRELGCAAGLVFPNEHSHRILTSKHVGLVPMFRPALMVRPLRAARLTQRIGGVSRRVTGAALRTAALLTDARAAAQPTLRDGAAPVDRFGAEFDRLWQEIAPSVRIGVVRDSAYLQWRYADHPIYRYERFAARTDGQVRGVVVGTAREVFGMRATLLVDLLAADEAGVGPVLIGALATAARARGDGIMVTLAIPGSPLHALFRRCGFLQVPARLDPKPFRTAGTVLTESARLALDPHNWYFTWGDIDVV